MQCALAGFGFTSCYDLFNPDRLHGGPKGILERIVKYIKIALEATEVGQGRRPSRTAYADANDLLLAAPGFPGLRLPKLGLDWPRITATEMAALARLLVVPLSGAPRTENGTLADLQELLIGDIAEGTIWSCFLIHHAAIQQQCCCRFPDVGDSQR